ncbi:hypothetical protein [Photobacterium sanguinicancri]|uniref:Flavodoxin n=1 Tax=Photobacterium sanguinicancri TaxID=875932 RepID=A0AAW7YAN1_9GAMM|nr:hypothetical protein [Photobacterium sanguinicancri]MDO6499046.1 hypothetical protein [Photobacterium sanguinicancri]MDO6544559.1 hypothetical protein [Photobacterium sanguinicancri]OZS42665.1 hypothetical protein ASV53_17235 [Photobacterium sanguinicancri]
MQLMIEQLKESKNTWMASHITDAEYPTELSQSGLASYQALHASSSTSQLVLPLTARTNSLSFYPVDCHPLTIRYAVTLASLWNDEKQREAVIEYLTQIMFEADSAATLFVGFFKGKPAACGMVFQNEESALISDVHALPLPNQDELIEEMTAYLTTQLTATNPSVFLEKTI